MNYGHRDMTIYTDGASSNNQNPAIAKAGFGVYFGKDDPRNASLLVKDAKKSNNVAELRAIEYALNYIDIDIIAQHELTCECPYIRYSIATDSTYCINALTEWIFKWRQNGWVSRKGFPIKNEELIESIRCTIDRINNIYHALGIPPFTFVKVPAHSNNKGNNMADKLAVNAVKGKQLSPSRMQIYAIHDRSDPSCTYIN